MALSQPHAVQNIPPMDRSVARGSEGRKEHGGRVGAGADEEAAPRLGRQVHDRGAQSVVVEVHSVATAALRRVTPEHDLRGGQRWAAKLRAQVGQQPPLHHALYCLCKWRPMPAPNPVVRQDLQRCDYRVVSRLHRREGHSPSEVQDSQGLLRREQAAEEPQGLPLPQWPRPITAAATVPGRRDAKIERVLHEQLAPVTSAHMPRGPGTWGWRCASQQQGLHVDACGGTQPRLCPAAAAIATAQPGTQHHNGCRSRC
mmetsp:Transcript_103367/g.287803  ORF Transcript_103367/g.287803 Transcript_103367/m.287803 type:complete len:257 (-) Transcript_103367:100-870(-)